MEKKKIVDWFEQELKPALSPFKLAALSDDEKEMKVALNAAAEDTWAGPPLARLHPAFEALK